MLNGAVIEMQISVVRDSSSLKSLENEWMSIFETADEKCYFYGFAWNWQAWQDIAEKRRFRLNVIVGRVDGRVVLIWPLVIGRFFVWQIAKWLGSQTLEYHDVLVRDEPDKHRWLEAAWAHLRSKAGADAILLEGVRDKSVAASILGAKRCTIRLYDYAPFIDWRDWEDWSSYFSSLSKNLRHDHRRRRRRLEAMGSISFERMESEAACKSVVEWMFLQKQQWADRKSTKLWWGTHPEFPDFIKRAAVKAQRSGNLFLVTLKLDDTLISALFGFCSGPNFYSWMVTHDPRWEKCSPGRLLQMKALELSRDAGHNIFDFLPRLTSFKKNFYPKGYSCAPVLHPVYIFGSYFCTITCVEIAQHIASSCKFS